MLGGGPAPAEPPGISKRRALSPGAGTPRESNYPQHPHWSALETSMSAKIAYETQAATAATPVTRRQPVMTANTNIRSNPPSLTGPVSGSDTALDVDVAAGILPALLAIWAVTNQDLIHGHLDAATDL